MKTSLKEIELNFKGLDLYKIVLDIEKYPEYIPWCSSLEIINRKKNEIRAKMVVNYKFIYSQKFTSCVFFDLKKKIIKTKYIDGPLKNLETNWEFIDLKKNGIYYFDSYGEPEPKEVKKLAERLLEQSRKLGKNNMVYKVNNVRHQYKNSECGVYSINFIVKLLEGNKYTDIISNKVADDDMNNNRNYYFVKE